MLRRWRAAAEQHVSRRTAATASQAFSALTERLYSRRDGDAAYGTCTHDFDYFAITFPHARYDIARRHTASFANFGQVSHAARALPR